MTIIWCGGEDIDFDMGACQLETATDRLRSDYSRVAIKTSVTGGAQAVSKKFTPVSSCWLSCQYWCQQFANGTQRIGFGLCSSKADARIGIGSHTSGSNYQISLLKWDGSYTLLEQESGTSFSYDTVHKVDIQITNYGPSGNIKVYVDNILVFNYTGDIASSGQTELDQIRLDGASNAGQICGAYSELIVADVDTRLLGVKTLVPNAAGDTNDWTGAYTDIDEATTSDADLIYTDAHGNDFQANLTGMPPGTKRVLGVRMAVRAADSMEVLGLKVGVKTNSAIHLKDARRLLGTYNTLDKIFDNNPATASAFTSGEIDALQLAIRCDSTTTTTSTTSTTTTTA